ncbi:MAG TPA: HAMP domain-containing sensor histidine kinase [Dyella sp.]|nr:HAMP domain-containing sensor histidine kinase [Dyella sp.]
MLHLIAVGISVMLGIYAMAPSWAVLLLIIVTSALAWLAARREWRPVSALAKLLNGWEERPDLEALSPEHLSRQTDADVASIARGLHGFATRIAGYTERERNFTRDASHELRSPLTVIKMSVDMLAEEQSLSDFGERSLLRIRRSAREMEALVEALLILARETDNGVDDELFVINDVLRHELEFARDMLIGRPIELLLEEPTRFALRGSPRVFAVLFWQLIRNACQQTERGRVVVTVMPGMVVVANQAEPHILDNGSSPMPPYGADRHGFELAIAQRISDRFAWPLELQTHAGSQNVASIRFPHTQAA